MNDDPEFVREFFVGPSAYPMYVQEWRSSEESEQAGPPLVFIHGGSHSGVFWTTAPDGSMGWARQFAAKGWRGFVVDWPGTGRSGCAPEDLPALKIDDVAIAVQALLSEIGNAVLIGHSIGAAVAYKVAERNPEPVLAIAALASAPTPNGNIALDTISIIDPDKPARSGLDGIREHFTSSKKFPRAHFEEYLASLVPFSPRIRNGALGGGREGANEDFRIDDLEAVRSVPILFATVEDDRISPESVSQATAESLGALTVSIDRDWGFQGHGHMFPIETGNPSILGKVEQWILAL